MIEFLFSNSANSAIFMSEGYHLNNLELESKAERSGALKNNKVPLHLNNLELESKAERSGALKNNKVPLRFTLDSKLLLFFEKLQ